MQAKKRKRATKEEILERMKARIVTEAKVRELKDQAATDPSAVINDQGEVKPLPIFTEKEDPISGAPTPSPVDPAKDDMLKKGLAEIVSEDIPRFLNNALILFKAEDRAKVVAVSPGRAALWAEFALPMLRKYFPDFDAEIMFWVLTASLFGSMIEIKPKGERDAKTTAPGNS